MGFFDSLKKMFGGGRSGMPASPAEESYETQEAQEGHEGMPASPTETEEAPAEYHEEGMDEGPETEKKEEHPGMHE